MNASHKDKEPYYAGADPAEAGSVLVCIHGRGGTGADIVRFAEGLEVDDLSFVAPQADGNSWYPLPFTEPRARNEPSLSAAHSSVKDTILEVLSTGRPSSSVFVLGFSQGACLALDLCARTHAGPWGGVFALSGGLIGTDDEIRECAGDLAGTPVFIGCGDRDTHIPEQRVRDSAEILEGMNARVEMRIYPGMEHRINRDEAEYIKKALSSAV